MKAGGAAPTGNTRYQSGELREVTDTKHALCTVREQLEALRGAGIGRVVDERAREDVVQARREILGLGERRAHGSLAVELLRGGVHAGHDVDDDRVVCF